MVTAVDTSHYQTQSASLKRRTSSTIMPKDPVVQTFEPGRLVIVAAAAETHCPTSCTLPSHVTSTRYLVLSVSIVQLTSFSSFALQTFVTRGNGEKEAASRGC
jgi:hypothetical protein